MKITMGLRWIGLSAAVAVALQGAGSLRAGAQSEFTRGDRMPYDAFDRLARIDLDVPGGMIHIALAPGDISLPREKVLD